MRTCVHFSLPFRNIEEKDASDIPRKMRHVMTEIYRNTAREKKPEDPTKCTFVSTRNVKSSVEQKQMTYGDQSFIEVTNQMKMG